MELAGINGRVAASWRPLISIRQVQGRAIADLAEGESATTRWTRLRHGAGAVDLDGIHGGATRCRWQEWDGDILAQQSDFARHGVIKIWGMRYIWDTKATTSDPIKLSRTHCCATVLVQNTSHLALIITDRRSKIWGMKKLQHYI